MPIPEVKLASLLYRCTPSGDENDFIHSVMEHCQGFESLTTYADQYWAFRDFDLASGFPLPEPDFYPLREHSMALFGLGADHGCRVALNGDMSNLVLGEGVYLSPHALRAVPLARLAAEMRYFKSHTGIGYIGLIARAYSPQALVDTYHRLLAPSRRRLNAPLPWLRGSQQPRSVPASGISDEIAHAPDLRPVATAALRFTMSAYNITRLAFHSGLA